jgi:hypothetical protein
MKGLNMEQKEWFSLDDISMVEDTNTIVDVLFSNGNIIDGTFYTYIEWFAIQGRYHVKHHMFKNKISEKSVEVRDLTIIGWKFKENKNDC